MKVGGVKIQAEADKLKLSGNNRFKDKNFHLDLTRKGKEYGINKALWQGKDKQGNVQTTPMTPKEAKHHLASINTVMKYRAKQMVHEKMQMQGMFKQHSPKLINRFNGLSR